MASILAYIELRGDVISRPSRYILAQARRIADAAGATVYALFTVGRIAQVTIDDMAADISAMGADRVLCCSDDGLAGPTLDATHGALLTQIAEQLRPLLFLFPAGGVGDELGPPLAVRIGAAYLAHATAGARPEERNPDPSSQRVVLSRRRMGLDGERELDVGDLERPVVATLATGSVGPNLGDPCIDVEMIPCPAARFSGVNVTAVQPALDAELETCRTLVFPPRDITADSMASLTSCLPEGSALVTLDGDPSAMACASPTRIVLLAEHPSLDELPCCLAPNTAVFRAAESEGERSVADLLVDGLSANAAHEAAS